MYVTVLVKLSLIYLLIHCWNYTISRVSVGLTNALATALLAQADSKSGLELMRLWAAKWLLWCVSVLVLKTWVSCYLSSLSLI